MSRLARVAAVVSLVGLTACQPLPGQPGPTPQTAPTCAADRADHGSDPLPAPRPPNVPGWQQMTIVIEVRALAYELRDGKYAHNPDREWCVPFQYHLDGSATGAARPTFQGRGGLLISTPVDSRSTTPFRVYSVVGWNSNRTEPPQVLVTLQATFDALRYHSTSNYGGPVAFRCAIGINGNPPIMSSFQEDARVAGFVRCDLNMTAIPGP